MYCKFFLTHFYGCSFLSYRVHNLVNVNRSIYRDNFKMIGRKFLFLILLLIICPCFSTALSFRKILGSENYAIVGFSNCTTTNETFVADGNCIRHMTSTEKIRYANLWYYFFNIISLFYLELITVANHFLQFFIFTLNQNH